MGVNQLILGLGALLLSGGLLWAIGLPTSLAATLPLTAQPIGYDGLSAAELAVVMAAAPAQGANGAAPRQELLLVERHDGGKGATPARRQGDLYLYDYATDTLIHQVVDVTSGEITVVERSQGVQLPLNANEERRALAFVQADATLWHTLTQRYRVITGEPLTTIDQLQSKVSVFHGDVMPERLNPAAQACGQHRCAQVLLFTVDKTLLEILPIVDLSQGTVVQVLETIDPPATE